jgi:PPOX class probable F420-dependent enzyme
VTIEALHALSEETYVSLTTFRRTGEAVATAVWIVRDGDDLLVTTGAASGKIKRIRNSDRVELVASDRAGKVAPDAVAVEALAVVLEDSDTRVVLDRLLLAKYGAQYRAIKLAAKLARREPGSSVAIRISARTA